MLVFPFSESSALRRQYCFFKSDIAATKRAHGYLLLGLTQDSKDLLRFRTNVFPHEYPPIIYFAINDETHKGEQSYSTRSKKRKTEKRTIISEGGKELVNSINECVLNVLNCNIPLSTCLERKLKKHVDSPPAGF
jgi:hypothetical protein